MAESFAFGVPALGDLEDVNVDYTLGTEWESDEDGQCTGVEWHAPATAPGATTVAGLWDKTSETLLASKTFTAVVGSLNTITFDTPVAITASTRYVVGVYTHRYTATTSYGWPATTTHLTAPSGVNGRLHVSVGGGVLTYPEVVSGNSATYHVSPIVSFDAATVSGVLTATLGALTATAVGTRTVHGVATAALGGVTAQAVGTRTVTATAAADLGAITATLTGRRTVNGVLTASLGGVTAAITVAGGTARMAHAARTAAAASARHRRAAQMGGA